MGAPAGYCRGAKHWFARCDPEEVADQLRQGIMRSIQLIRVRSL
jgi:hypothetical protein